MRDERRETREQMRDEREERDGRDVFERLGVSFVPVAMSIFGNRGEALEKFISSVAKFPCLFPANIFLTRLRVFL